jgi:hypothetical protein
LHIDFYLQDRVKDKVNAWMNPESSLTDEAMEPVLEQENIETFVTFNY